MKVRGLKSEDVKRQLESEGYYVNEEQTEDDIVLDVYADENSQRILEMTFDNIELKCVAYCFVQSGFANHYASHIAESLEALW